MPVSGQDLADHVPPCLRAYVPKQATKDPRMSLLADTIQPDIAGHKSVQEYIDELPVWSDGTTLKSSPMTGMQWRIWALAASGKFFEGFVVFMGGVTVPPITREFALSAGEAGLVTSASLAGLLVGTILLGGLSDYFGRKLMFIARTLVF